MKTKINERRVLVTGGAGFIGSNFLNAFVPRYENYRIINVDALTYAGHLSNISVSEKENYVFEKVDIRDIAELRKIFAKHKPTDIIHLAAETHVDFSIIRPSVFVQTNVIGTNNLLVLAREHNINRFVHVSTDEVYGSLKESEEPFTTTSPIQPNNPYSASKAGSDMLVRAYHKTFGLDTVITRCSNNYGPNQDLSKFIPKVINNLLENKSVPVYAEGLNLRDWIYVGDHVEALDLVFHKGSSGEIYNIGGNSQIRNVTIAKRLIKMLEKSESSIEFVTDRKGHDFRYAFDTTEMQRSLGWKAKVSLEEGLKKTVTFYKKRASGASKE